MKKSLAVCTMFLVLAGLPVVSAAQAPSGAIFTTLEDGTEVNLNQFPTKESVYLDGGPGPGAPQEAAGLDDGVYVFMVTDPSGKTLLSEDFAVCRRFNVTDGIITGVIPTGGCEHNTGLDVDHGAATVQLMPYSDTPNPGGVYKAWAMLEANFPSSCLNQVDCFVEGTKHGFSPSFSKTDNFKIVGENVREIDTRFFLDRNHNGHYDYYRDRILANMSLVWTDTNGVQNTRYSDPGFAWGVLAHVEVPEDDMGLHYITIPNQPGCTVTHVHLNGNDAVLDSQGRIAVDVSANIDYLLEVACTQGKGTGKK